MTSTEPTTGTSSKVPKDKKYYIFYDKMDDVNKKAMDVFASQGMDAAIKHMFTDQETGRTLTYGEMRARYG
jgi:hypothetical protein